MACILYSKKLVIDIMSEISKSTLDWYGVKLLHKITISGIPDQDKIDEFFQNTKVFYWSKHLPLITHIKLLKRQPKKITKFTKIYMVK